MTDIFINLPAEIGYITETLNKDGHEAYIVGGCVRDSLLGVKPKDWDICTSAIPEQTIKCFENHHIIQTGLQHGTITLMLNHQPFEITTYRRDGIYSDNRRPDTVEFVNNLREDLSRRDFTVNSMAYNQNNGLIDFFDGEKDLKNNIIRCVGNADKRFNEDALRIMRALRFSSVLGFSIEDKTSDSIFKNKSLLQNIAVERISVELNKLITGTGAFDILRKYTSVIAEFIPEIMSLNESDLYNILKSMEFAPANVILRLAVLFHEFNPDTACDILKRLKYDNNIVNTVKKLVLYHDEEIVPDRINIKRWLNKIGENIFRSLIEVKKAKDYKDESLFEILELLNEIIEQKQCFCLKDLVVNGDDLIDMGVFEGIKIKLILNQLLDMVIDEKIDNDKTKLLEIAGNININNL